LVKGGRGARACAGRPGGKVGSGRDGAASRSVATKLR
jgi:hypothetical protein